MAPADPEPKPVFWLHGEVKSPPFSTAARHEAGHLLRRLQLGERLGMPHSRPIPSIGPGVHDLRVSDGAHNWRLVYRSDVAVVVVAAVFAKMTRQTPKYIIDTCRQRLRAYDATVKGEGRP